MKIIITPNKKERKISVPLSALSLFARFLPVEKEKLTKKVVRDIIYTLKQYKKLHGSFVLLEVAENNEQVIKIVI